MYTCVINEFLGFRACPEVVRCLYPVVTAVLSWLMSYSSDSTLRQIPPAARLVMLGGESVPPLECQESWCCFLQPSLPSTEPCLWKGSGGAVLQQNCSQESQSALPNGNSAPFTSCTSTRGTTGLLPQGSPGHICFSLVCFGKLCFQPLLQEFSSWPCFSAREKSQILLSTAQFGYKYLSVDDRRLRNHSINVAALGVEKVLRNCDSETGSMTPLSQLRCSLPQHSSLHQNYCCWEFCVVFSSPLALLLICQVYKAFFPVTLILISMERKS